MTWDRRRARDRIEGSQWRRERYWNQARTYREYWYSIVSDLPPKFGGYLGLPPSDDDE